MIFIIPGFAQPNNQKIAPPIPIGNQRISVPITIASTDFIDANITAPRRTETVMVSQTIVTKSSVPTAPLEQGIGLQLPIAEVDPAIAAEIVNKEKAEIVTPLAPSGRPALKTLSTEEKKERLKLLKAVLGEAYKQSNFYNKTFRDLSAEEIRVSEIMLGNQTKLKRVVVNDLVVYQSRLEDQMAYEYRITKSVDAKPIKIEEKHLEYLFKNLLEAKTTKRELELMNNEGFRYDLELGGHFYGLTLFQWREISDWAIADVGFEITGRDKIDGKDVVVVYFQQLRPNKQLEWQLPKNRGFEKGEQRTRGVLYFDATNFQLRRAERELTLQFAPEAPPISVWKQTLNFRDSIYGILVPANFVAEYYYYILKDKNGYKGSILSGRTTSTFGEFKRFNVTSEEEKKKTIIKP